MSVKDKNRKIAFARFPHIFRAEFLTKKVFQKSAENAILRFLRQVEKI